MVRSIHEMFLHNMHIYQLKITLMDVRSLIWRLLRVGCENVPQFSFRTAANEYLRRR